MADDHDHEFESLAEFPCAFCEGVVTAGITDGEHETLLHTEPFCKPFEDLSIPDYLEQNRLKLEAQLLDQHKN